MKPVNSKSMIALDQILTDTMREAANEASMADGVISYSHGNNQNQHSSSNPENKMKKLDLRRGKWTPEEEAYANRLIEEFKNGMLPIADGTTLRTFLSKLLNCDPMRISKKYVGNNCIGKQVYRQRHAELEDIPPEVIERSRRELEELERQFLDRSKQSSARNRPNKSEVPIRVSRPKKEDYTRSNLQSNGMIAPWIVPSNSYSYSPETNNPYSRGASEQVEKPRQQPGYGLSERQSEIDLYNLPDAFASTSSLDLLGTLAEMKLPSAKSLENLQKYGMEGGPSTASLSEWYSVLADSNPSYNSMNDMTSPRNDSQHRLMPWDLKGSQEAISNTQKSANSPHQIKHSLSRELLQAAADAEARDEAKSELEKILRAQQIEKLKQEKNVSTQPVVPDVKMSAIDARRSSSIDNFMMLVEMGDIPKPDSSILSKNIFIEGATNTHQSQGTATGSQNNQTTLNKRNRSRDSLVNSDDLQKKLKYTQEEDDDSFVDAQILSAAVVRKPFT